MHLLLSDTNGMLSRTNRANGILVMAARRDKSAFRFPPPPSDPSELRVVPEVAGRFPEAYTAKENERRFTYCLNRRRHNYVRSVTTSLRQKVTAEGRKFWRVEESTVWCWDCGVQHPVRHLEDFPITKAEYERLRKPKTEGMAS